MTRSLLTVAVLAAVLSAACGGDDVSPSSPTTITSSGGSSSGGGGIQSPCAAPIPPTGLRVTSQNRTQVELSWDAVAGATSYTLVVGSKPGGNDTLDSPTTQTFFRFTAKDGKQYARVQANGPCGDGITSPTIEFVVTP